jgi:hypothetical protein
MRNNILDLEEQIYEPKTLARNYRSTPGRA